LDFYQLTNQILVISNKGIVKTFLMAKDEELNFKGLHRTSIEKVHLFLIQILSTISVNTNSSGK
jgi:hypothetical protein